MAFTLQQTLDGSYNAHLNQQPVFAFLPLRKYGLKFILQGDFVLHSSREEVDGDSPWNQWLLSEFPGLFVSAERSFCNLLCFKDNPAKGVTAYMSFVPLVGEVHGFFSSLPRMILSRLLMSNCLIVESTETEWVPPCKVLRNWTQEARNLLPDSLLRKHLGVGFLHKDIVLPDLLARALGIEEYGLKVLLQVITSLCSSEDGLTSMSLGWLCAWLNSVYKVSSHGKNSSGFETETDLMKDLKKIPFIPLSDGKYGSLDEGAIWLHADQMGATTNDEYAPETFPRLYLMIRTVSPALLSAAAALGTSCSDSSIVDNVTRMLYRVGIKRDRTRELLTKYYAFLMFHLQLSCPDCQSVKDQIIREVRDNACMLTNFGCKRPIEFPIHFSKQFENPVDMSRLIQGLDFEWHEIEDIFLKHPINKLLSGILQVEKSISDVCSVPIATSDEDLNSKGSTARDWVSDEFADLLSRLSSMGDKEKCKYLLEVLDSLWDDNFADKALAFVSVPLENDNYLTLHSPEPSVRSKKLLTALDLKIQVTVDDTLAILKVWRAKLPVSASFSQMSKFYTFIWSRMNTSEKKVIEELRNEPFVFVPCKLAASHEDVASGVLLSSKEVFWRDLTGSTDQVKIVCPEYDPHSVQHPFTKMLCSVYPSLHDFFVKECGVDEFPHFHGYLQILLQLSSTALPSQAAKNVFQIFLKWVDELNSGSLRSEDIGFLKQGLLTKEYLVLPTAEDKWVSLNPSFGLICWCDDDKLRKVFKYFDDIKFLYFGELNDDEKEILKTKVSIFLRKLNIPSLSEVVTREAIYYGPTDSSFVASVVNWTLPQTGFENLKCLQIVIVEKLFYKNVIKSSHIASKKRFESSSLLEGKILYAPRESDSQSIFMELSRLFSFGTPNLHLANFLHMITTIRIRQKMPKLPASESVWSLANVPLSKDGEIGLMSSSRTVDEKTPVTFQKRSGISSNWPPSDWKTAPGSAAKSPAASGIKIFAQAPTEITNFENVDNDRASAAATVKMTFDPPHSMTIPHDLNYSSSDVSERDHLYVGTTDPQQALLTGRLGEFVAFKYFVGKHGEPFVKWVNETNETGLPYDLVVGDDEYIEVKSTRATGKDWFHITSREWQFAVEKGESFCLAHVVLSPDNTALVTVYKNPVSLCQLGKLQLALTIHKS
ncbi:hypothetical protein R3W88_025805 [Solanum pinnatisectum]|uniref:Protein NO VEIN C-terminal domain-containing protein n=1 Tax=Solanum pinnatisectum TaxID=50273 RepID=A0AAV9M4P9_9SOLN|nr:hypothetical protein R3W88_025805 [Solanum pinnatisectum]